MDLIVLPEMALTGTCGKRERRLPLGYIFDSLNDIEPFLEDPFAGDSKTLSLTKALAKRCECYVIAGFPERASARALQEVGDASSKFDARTPMNTESASAYLPKHKHKAFNSAMLVDSSGALVKVFRKHFLYETDTTWADEGTGFEYIDLPSIGRVCVAICMDLNPYTLEGEFDKYELAKYCTRNKVDYLVMPMNWLLPEEEVENYEIGTSNDAQPCVANIHYWVARCVPLWVPGMSKPEHDGHKICFIACNRVGKEGNTIFSGSSAVISFTTGDRADLLGAMGTKTQGVLLLDTASS